MSKAPKPRRPVLSVQALEGRDVPATAALYGSTLIIDGTSGHDSIVVRQDSSRITVDGTSIRDGWRTASYLDAPRVRQVVVRAHNGDDTINLSTLRVDSMVWGGWGNDRVYGGSADDTAYGDQGNDTVLGASGNDWLVGGDGFDQVFGGAGNDWVTGDNGDDRLYGDAGNDSLSGGEGRDFLSSGAGDDELDGHGFGLGRADAAKNFDTYQNEFDLWRPVPATMTAGAPPVLKKGELDNPGYLAALGALSLGDVKAAVKVVARGTYDVYLAGDRRTIRVTFDGTWTDTDPMPAADSSAAFAMILLNRARLISFGIDPARSYSDAEWNALNDRTGGKLYDPVHALRQFTGRGVATLYPPGTTFTTVKTALDRGAAAVAYSFRASTRTPNSFGIAGDTSYVLRRLFTDARGRQWAELYNPTGSDVGNGKLLDYLPGAVQQNDGIITIPWDDFRRSSNFTALYVA
jgi:RTX calcium-binding nonapeptide repeat (4 copies)